jgi:hypothetical protein
MGLGADNRSRGRRQIVRRVSTGSYLPDKSVLVRCFDADPINNTLANFPALNAVKVDLIETSDKGRRIDPRRFDDLVEQITGQPAEAHVIVETGSSAFVPLLHYMLSNEVQAILSQGGHQLMVHTIVTGGQALLDTLHGAAQLVKQMDAARFVIWLNPFWDRSLTTAAPLNK